MMPFTNALQQTASQIEQVMDAMLPVIQGPEARLFEAMRYASLNGGKRLRPFLTLGSARLFDVREECAARAAAAVEFVHCYSLAHDDLPCMDDDDLRRGKPSTHRQFNEATAVLAGDALQSLAFEILCDPATHADPYVRCELVRGLSAAAGAHGMAGGQMFDLQSENQNLTIGAITRLQQLKTGALIGYACEAGAILGHASPQSRQALLGYAHDFGLAFQIIDDLLDIEGNTQELGKSAGKDVAAGKSTIVAHLGAERARAQAKLLSDQAIRHLDLFDKKADPLRQAACFAIDRRA